MATFQYSKQALKAREKEYKELIERVNYALSLSDEPRDIFRLQGELRVLHSLLNNIEQLKIST